jgi:integrase
MQLNDSFARVASPGIHWDDKLKGFGLRVGKNRRAWLTRVGRGRNHRLGIFPLMSAAQAREHAKTLLAEKTLGKVIPKSHAFEDALTEFIEDAKQRLRPSTIRQYVWHLALFPFGRKNLADIARRDIEQVLKKQSRSVKEHLDRIGRTFFSWCVRKELIDRSPFEKMDKPPQGKSRERALSVEELRAVWKAVKAPQSPVERFVWLMLRLAQRPGETRRFKWEYISETRIVLPGGLMKNGNEQILPLTSETYLTIQSFPKLDGSPYLFPASRTHVRGKPTEVMTFVAAWKGFVKKCGTAWFTKHDLRRTVATRMADDLQIEPHIIERLLHHSGDGLARTYNRATYQKELLEALLKWETYLSTLAA